MKRIMIVFFVLIFVSNLLMAGEPTKKEEAAKRAWYLLGVTTVSGFMAYDYMITVNEIDDELMDYTLLQIETNIDYGKIMKRLGKQRDRKMITGMALIGFSAASFFLFVDSFDLFVSPNSVQLSYKF
jgi:hypothetical protein